MVAALGPAGLWLRLAAGEISDVGGAQTQAWGADAPARALAGVSSQELTCVGGTHDAGRWVFGPRMPRPPALIRGALWWEGRGASWFIRGLALLVA